MACFFHAASTRYDKNYDYHSSVDWAVLLEDRLTQQRLAENTMISQQRMASIERVRQHLYMAAWSCNAKHHQPQRSSTPPGALPHFLCQVPRFGLAAGRRLRSSHLSRVARISRQDLVSEPAFSLVAWRRIVDITLECQCGRHSRKCVSAYVLASGFTEMPSIL